ncbi:MAG: sulfatase-like hydrolase/transferase, partial [Verrucomicrobiota bacterium]
KQLRAEVGRLPQSAQTYNFSEDWDEDAIVAEHAIRYLDQAGENPFFLGVSMRKPHFPFLVHEDYYAPYEDTVDMPTVTQAMLDNLPKQNRKHREKYGFAEMTDAQTKKARAVYYGMVQFIDSQIGRILKKLDEKGLRENTIIVYLSDHGEMAGEHGLWYKNAFYQASAAVPMIISHPKTLDVGKQVDANVMLTDLFPTLCDMCGIDRPDELQGRSLVPLMKQKVTTNKRPAICETYSDPRNPGRMIRRGDWKYNWFTDGKKQLFNIAKDPGETTDLIGEKQHADLVAKLHDLSMETFIPTPDSVFDQIKKEKEQQQKQAA